MSILTLIRKVKKPKEWEQNFFKGYLECHTKNQISSHQLARLLLKAPDSFIVTCAMGHSYDSFYDRCSHGKLEVVLSKGDNGMSHIIIGDSFRDNAIEKYPNKIVLK